MVINVSILVLMDVEFKSKERVAFVVFRFKGFNPCLNGC